MVLVWLWVVEQSVVETEAQNEIKVESHGCVYISLLVHTTYSGVSLKSNNPSTSLSLVRQMPVHRARDEERPMPDKGYQQ